MYFIVTYFTFTGTCIIHATMRKNICIIVYSGRYTDYKIKYNIMTQAFMTQLRVRNAIVVDSDVITVNSDVITVNSDVITIKQRCHYI